MEEIGQGIWHWAAAHPRIKIIVHSYYLPAEGVLQVVHLERHMRDGLHQVGNGRTIPIAHPLDAERIALMVTHRDLQVGQIDFSFKVGRCRNTNVIELHGASLHADNDLTILTTSHIAPPMMLSPRRTSTITGIRPTMT